MIPRSMCIILAVMLLPTGIACASQPDSASSPTPAPAPTSPAPLADDARVVAESAPMAQAPGAGQAATTRSRAEAQTAPAEEPAEATPPETDESPQDVQQLIYTGSVILAIYDVDDTQQRVVELVESMDGYISERTSEKLTARVPAASFRDAMDDIAELGDVLDTAWQAQDVTEEVRDLEIRLRNALELRDRLEVLLEDAETVEEALAIESELERITLEIERIRGQLDSFEHRIAYSTIDVEFRAKRMDEVPDDEFLLPFSWLQQLGLESLLRSPEVHR